MRVLKARRCTNCGIGEMKVTLENGGLFISCGSCGFRELLWKPGMVIGKLVHVLKREEIGRDKLPTCLRKIIDEATPLED
jgi:hypothetical protein